MGRLGEFELVEKVVTSYEALRMKSDRQLCETYEEEGLPAWDGMERQHMLEAFKIVLTWEFLPIHELQHECKQRGLLKNTHTLFNNTKERRRALIQWLSADLHAITASSASSELGQEPESQLQEPEFCEEPRLELQEPESQLQ